MVWFGQTLRSRSWAKIANKIANITFHKLANEADRKYAKQTLTCFLLFWPVKKSILWNLSKFFAKYASLTSPAVLRALALFHSVEILVTF